MKWRQWIDVRLLKLINFYDTFLSSIYDQLHSWTKLTSVVTNLLQKGLPGEAAPLRNLPLIHRSYSMNLPTIFKVTQAIKDWLASFGISVFDFIEKIDFIFISESSKLTLTLIDFHLFFNLPLRILVLWNVGIRNRETKSVIVPSKV